jgi:hypothetical protein
LIWFEFGSTSHKKKILEGVARSSEFEIVNTFLWNRLIFFFGRGRKKWFSRLVTFCTKKTTKEKKRFSTDSLSQKNNFLHHVHKMFFLMTSPPRIRFNGFFLEQHFPVIHKNKSFLGTNYNHGKKNSRNYTARKKYF